MPEPPASQPAQPPPQPAPDGEITPGLRAHNGSGEAIHGAAIAEAERRAQLAKLAALLDDPPALLLSLPGIYGEALQNIVAAAVLKAVNSLGGALPVKAAGHLCATCVGLQHAWAARNAPAINAAKKQAMAVIGATSESDPRLAQIDLAAFLPENLRPGQAQGVPQVFDAAYELDGTSLCPAHHPAAAAGKGSLIAMPGMSLHAAAQIAMSGAPGLPGMPVPVR